MNKAEIEERLLAARIPPNALSTTLPKLEQFDLRNMIEAGDFEYEYQLFGEDKLGYRGAIMHCAKDTPYYKVRKVADVFAKELVLFGYGRVQVTTLSYMMDRVEHDGDWYFDGFRGHTVIKDFYMGDMECPYTARMLQRFQSQITDLMDQGNAFSFIAATETQPEHWAWYGAAFLKTIVTECIVAEVKCPMV
mgnify:CR=1 FL=1